MSNLQMKDTSPSIYEERILKRGQNLLWYSAIACFCISDTGRVDPNCLSCHGSGFIMEPVKKTRQIIEGTVVNEIKLDLSSRDISILSINRLAVNAGTEMEVSSFTSTTVIPQSRLQRGQRFVLDCEVSLEKTYSGSCTFLGRKLIRVPVGRSTAQGFFPAIITNISSLSNETKAQNIEIESIWSNKILIKSVVDDGDKLTITCTYILPMIFLISGIDPKTQRNNLLLQESDLQMSFPGTYAIGRGDLFVLLAATMKETMSAINDNTSYKLPHSRIAEILSIRDKYSEITDYTLVRDNEIIWGGYIPKRFSISFTYYPVYAVNPDLPTLRYSEDKIFPKKVYLKKVSTFTLANDILKEKDPDYMDVGILDDSEKENDQGGLV